MLEMSYKKGFDRGERRFLADEKKETAPDTKGNITGCEEQKVANR